MTNKPEKYILRNISNREISISDLGYKIPAGESRDLLGKKSGVTWEKIQVSKEKGTLSLKLGKTLVEIENIVVAHLPTMTQVIREAITVKFPDRTKSIVIVDVGNISDEVQNLTIIEEEELLKQLETESLGDGQVPMVFGDED
jgi:hypothetical protein